MGLPMGDEDIPGHKPVVNMALIAANVVLYFVGVTAPWVLVPGARSYNDVVEALGMIPAYIAEGSRLYTILTAMFLHGSIAHLLGNMIYLYIFGDNIEAVMGRVKYALFYLLSGLGAALFHVASIAFMPQDSLVNAALTTGNPWLVPAIGASGAISGVLGAYLIMFPASTIRVVTFWGWFPLMLSLPAYVYIAFWFIYQFIMGVSVSLIGVSAGIAFWAHIGGFLTGMALVPLLVSREDLERVSFLMAWRGVRWG